MRVGGVLKDGDSPPGPPVGPPMAMASRTVALAAGRRRRSAARGGGHRRPRAAGQRKGARFARMRASTGRSVAGSGNAVPVMVSKASM